MLSFSYFSFFGWSAAVFVGYLKFAFLFLCKLYLKKIRGYLLTSSSSFSSELKFFICSSPHSYYLNDAVTNLISFTGTDLDSLRSV